MKNLTSVQYVQLLRQLTGESFRVRRIFRHRAQGNGLSHKVLSVKSKSVEGTIETIGRFVSRVNFPDTFTPPPF